MTMASLPAPQDTAAPKQRRGRRARTEVALVMAVVTVVAVLIVGLFNFWTARSFLNTTVESQLQGIGDSRVARIESGLASVEALASTLAADLGVVRALDELTAGYQALDETLTEAQIAELRMRYETALAQITPPGVEPLAVDEVFPTSERAQYLQYHYLVANPFEDRSQLDDAGDGSGYSAAHAAYHPMLRDMSDAVDLGDVLLIDAETSNVVYSVDKHAEFGTNLARGPYRDSALAEAVLGQLTTAAVGEAVFVDFQPYAPVGFQPTGFIAVAIRDEGRVTGAIAVEVPNAALGALTTAGGDWKGTGLGDTGEVYIVGDDGLMRSDARLWLEDPEAYLAEVADAGYPQEISDALKAFGTTVLIQPVDSEAVDAGLAGDTFEGVTTNYLDHETLSYATPLDFGGLQWVAVTEVATSEAYGPLRSHIFTLVVMMLVLIPVVVSLAYVIARRLLRPIEPIIDAAQRVGDGVLDVDLVIESHDEFGDIANKFNGVVESLRGQAAELERAEAESSDLLAAVLPSRLVGQFQRGELDVGEALSNATLVAITVEEAGVKQAREREAMADHAVGVSAGIAKLAERFGLEQIVSSATQYVAVAGLDMDTDDASSALAFADAVRTWLSSAGDAAGVVLTTRMGLASGDVVAGVVGTEPVAFNVWGNPRRRAGSLATIAGPGEILIDPTVARHTGDSWAVTPVVGLVDLNGAELEGWRVVGRKAEIDASWVPSTDG